MGNERQSPNLQDYIGLYGPKFGPQFYEEALDEAKFEQQLPQILKDLEPLVKDVANGERPFSLVAIMTQRYQAFTLTDPSWAGNWRFMDDIMEAVQARHRLRISKKLIGNYRAFVEGWFVYNPERLDPSSRLADARMKAKLIKTFFLPPK